ncbi:MAG: alpha/beta hydrolase [Myxococcota bacterium]
MILSTTPKVHASPPTTARPRGAPSRTRTFGEWRTVIEPLRLGAAVPRLARAPRGDGRLVVDIPGWLAPEASMAPLRAFLRAKGHDARGWGLGTNRGNPERDCHRLIARLEALVADSGRAANLVAWSLGGVIAREAGRLRPDLVHRIVTYGTPVIGGPTHTTAAPHYGEDTCRQIAQRQALLDQEQPLQVPVVVIFSPRDGVVDWRACIDHTSPRAEHVEVSSTHIGLGMDPDVWSTVARAFAGS